MSDDSSTILPPSYKPGDFHFDFDASNVFYVRSAVMKDGLDANEVKKSLYRQVVYWRHQAETETYNRKLLMAYEHLQAQHEAALETIASMARAIEKLADGKS